MEQMIYVVVFLFGLLFGMFIMALLTIAKQSDEIIEKQHKNTK